MNLINKVTATVELFSKGSLSSSAKLLGYYQQEDSVVLFVDKSPFHPSDYKHWDQPGDKGSISLMGLTIPVEDSSIFYCDESGNVVFPSSKAEARRGVLDGKLIPIIGHLVSVSNFELILKSSNNEEVVDVMLSVDQSYRSVLSRTHSAVHLMSLCLNELLNKFWKKDVVQKDSRGFFNFDGCAIENSTITTAGSEDVYRIGKSVRKKGFSIDVAEKYFETEFAKDLKSYFDRIVEENASSPIIISKESDIIGDFSEWKAMIDNTECLIPCGGTHVEKIGDIGKANFSVSYSSELNQLCILTKLNDTE